MNIRIATKTVLLAAILTLAYTYAAPAQETAELVNWLKENAVAVKTIDSTLTEDDFADLMPLVDLIGSARVVGLGEATHGDGAMFHAKTRLIKFLHEVMGFDVLVWESGMYDCHLVEKALAGGEPMSEAWKNGIFPIWAMSEQVQPLFDYIQQTRATESPLEIAGMDSQMTGQNTITAIGKSLKELQGYSSPQETLDEALALIAEYSEAERWKSPPAYQDIDYKAFDRAAALVIAELDNEQGTFAAIKKTRKRMLLSRMLKNLSAMVEMRYWSGKSTSDDARDLDMMRYALAREVAMSDTLVWLASEYYPNRKLIVWAASSHLTHDSRTVEMQTDDGGWKYDVKIWTPMGNRVRGALGNDYYVIDFIAYEGEIGSVAGWSRPLQPAPEGSFDALCHETGEPFLFVDLRSLPERDGGAWLRERRIARPRGYAPMRASWPQVCSAFFFTNTMFPSTFHKPKPKESASAD